MALRSGYYGLKRRTRDKLLNLLEAVPAGIGIDNPIASKNDVFTSIDLLDDTVGWISKNKADSSKGAVSGTNIFTYNSADKTVTVNGTGGANNSQYSIPINVSGDFYFLGCPEGGSNMKYDIYMYDNTAGARVKQWDGVTQSLSNYGSTPCQCKIPEGHNVVLTLRVFEGFAADGLIFKPMLITKDAYDLSPTYEPYHESVAEMLAVKSGSIVDSTGVTQYANWSFTHKMGNLVLFQYRFTVGEENISVAETVIANLGIKPIKNDNIYQFVDCFGEVTPVLLAVNNQGNVVLVGGFTLVAGKTYVGSGVFMTNPTATANREISAAPDTREASEPAELLIEEEPVKKTTTRKKSTAKADTEKEGE